MTAFTLLLTVLALVVLRWCLKHGLFLTLALLDRATQYCRDGLTMERIHRQAHAHQQRLQALRRRQPSWCLIDLDGRKCLLDREQLEPFTRRCRAELGLQAPCSLRELRRHWRRSSLRWHPDRGGEHEAWLRRLRAYEALCQLSREGSSSQLVTTQPQSLPSARRWPRRWRWLRYR
jgi:hypothetical protein